MQYRTAQREELTSFFRSHPDSFFTLEELKGALPAIGQSTLYRQVGELVDAGIIRRTEGVARGASYQYLACGQEASAHLHLQCLGCGRFIHLDEQTSLDVERLVAASAGFELQCSDTTLYGVCRECQKKAKDEKK